MLSENKRWGGEAPTGMWSWSHFTRQWSRDTSLWLREEWRLHVRVDKVISDAY